MKHWANNALVWVWDWLVRWGFRCSVQCTLYRCTVYRCKGVKWTGVKFSLYRCTVYRCTVYRCTVHSVQTTVYRCKVYSVGLRCSVQCTLQCTLYTVQVWSVWLEMQCRLSTDPSLLASWAGDDSSCCTVNCLDQPLVGAFWLQQACLSHNWSSDVIFVTSDFLK